MTSPIYRKNIDHQADPNHILTMKKLSTLAVTLMIEFKNDTELYCLPRVVLKQVEVIDE